MRTFGVLAGGWVFGGALIMALGAGVPASAPAATAKTASTRPVPRVETVTVPSAQPSGPVAIPVFGVTARELKDTFTQRRGGGRTHGALDILAPRGTPVVAAVDGTIRKLFNSKAGGVTIYQFDVAEERVYYYAHLEKYADGLHEGQFVKQGEVIGYVGISGNAPPGTPHLHFAIEILTAEKRWWKGTPINPYPVLTTTSASELQ